MNSNLKKYLDIEFAGLSKQKRSLFHSELLNQISSNDFKFEEIASFLDLLQKSDIVLRQPFFEKIIYPILDEEISLQNTSALKHLIKLEQKFLILQNKTANHQPSKRQLILEGLRINPDDKELLEMYESNVRNYLHFTIHEIPLGVLYDMDGASENDCDELLQTLKDYEKVCEKLSLDRHELIRTCRFHFENYKAYLHKKRSFKSYQDFLAQNSQKH